MSNEMTGKNGEKLSKMWLAPLIIMIAVVPLITIIHVYDCGLEKNAWFSAGGRLNDFFLYYKALAIRAMGIFALFFLIYLMAFYDRSFLNKRSVVPLVCLGLFGIGSLVSAIFASHTYEAFFGGYEQFEGWLVLFAYIACFLLAFGFLRTVKLVRFILDVVMIAAAVVGILGFFQAIGIDWIQSDWAKMILTPELAGGMDLSKFNIKLNFGKGMSYVTLYNPNYVGSYVALILPYCVFNVICGEKLWRRITASLTSILLVITLLASKSLTGILGVLIAGVVAGILILPKLKKAKIIAISGTAILIGAAVSIVILQPSFFAKLFGEGTENYYIESMTTSENKINITTGSGKKMIAEINTNELKNSIGNIKNIVKIKDASGKEIKTEQGAEMMSVTVSEEGYEPIRFSQSFRFAEVDEYENYKKEYDIFAGNYVTNSLKSGLDEEADNGSIPLISVQDGQNIWNFTPVEDDIYIYNSFNRIDTLKDIQKSGFKNKYYFASRRGYIWSRTIPLLTEHLLIGTGPDNFVYAFPNDDYVGKKYMGYENQTITKPHDMYMQIWVQDGLPALLGFLALYVVFLIRAFVLCFSKKKIDAKTEPIYKNVVIVTAAAATGYLIVGFANDSTITVAPVYWCLLGLGYACEGVADTSKL